MTRLTKRLDFQKESGGLGLLRSHSRAKSGDAVKADGSLAEPEDAAKDKKERSRSWFSPHRRKDSVASTILRSTKSLRRLSAVSSSASSQPALSTPTTPSFSRGSYESDAAFHHRKLSSVGSGDATRPGMMAETAPTDPPSIPYPPHRPERPQEDLFEGTVLEKANPPSHRHSRSRSILRQFSPFPGPSIKDMRRSSQQSEHTLQTNIVTTAAALTAANQPSPDTDQAHNPADAGTDAASCNAPVYESPATGPGVPKRRSGYWIHSHGTECGVTRKASIASSFHFPVHRRPSQVTAEIESRKHARSSRWTLTENMAEMFKSQHIKTDKQPLSPAQIEAIWNGQDNGKKSPKRKSKDRRKKAASDMSASMPRQFGGPLAEQQSPLFRDSFQWPDRGTTPIPMSRADIKKRALPFEITVPPPPSTILVSPEIIHGDVSPKSPSKIDRRQLGQLPLPQVVLYQAEEEEEAVVEDDDSSSTRSVLPVVPPKNPARFAVRAPTMPLLPPIPEGFRSATGSNRSSGISGHRRSRSMNNALEVKDETVQFNSTPFSMTTPPFRHGPIVLSDTGSRSSVATVEATEDEHPVDWTAFQTAILGGASADLDGLFPEEVAQPDEEEGHLAEDVTTWFEGFGFETHGELIASDKSSQQKSERSAQRDSSGSMTSAASTPSTVQTDAEAELQTPVFVLFTDMLRRPPTTLQITAEDIASYEDRRASEALRAAQQAHAAEVAARATTTTTTSAAAKGAGGSGEGSTAAAAAGGGEAATQQTTAAMGDLGLGQGQQGMEGVQEGREGRARRAREERIGVGRRAR
ncbi:uncharacterized protein TRIREDRAFT_122666 [Trichoderma reesei QM6a]|uniref:Predicted protein n=2 Tax=Hypocrea jecorina TaxID=51453 RepID=G0RNL0_HYPJQ|nr:uncharacterized protein TRIREDRAFT_122666 [Trichoderma reesei QM6a]EGR47172.1 predicted protein [Trichoderma reesei QM6a]